MTMVKLYLEVRHSLGPDDDVKPLAATLAITATRLRLTIGTMVNGRPMFAEPDEVGAVVFDRYVEAGRLRNL